MSEARVVIVTGASSGIGKCAAYLLAERGDHVFLMARGRGRLVAVAEECRRLGAASATIWTGDVADSTAVQALFDEAVSTFGRVDAVVHSAGVAAYGRFVDIPPETFDKVIETNLLGTATVGRVALRQLGGQSGGGRIVFVGSLLGSIVTPFMTPYVTSKWGVHGLVRALQIEARTMPDVDVTLVVPGGVDTPIYQLSASVSGRQGQPPPPVDPPEKVARAAVRALDHPRRTSSVGVANAFAVLGFRGLPGVFDRLVTPLMSVFGLDPTPVEPHQGNVFEPQDEPSTSYGQHDAAAVRAVRRLANGMAALVSRDAAVEVRASDEGPTSVVDGRGRPSADADDGDGTLDLDGTVPVELLMNTPASSVWHTLADGWVYATWVVGASRVRKVDAEWPATGAAVHHSFGLWPLVISDTTEVLECDEGRHLRLRAHGGRAGDAEVDIVLSEVSPGSTLVSIREDAVAGPGTLVPRAVRQLLILPRNTEALRRLAYLAERREPERQSIGPASRNASSS